MTSGPVARVPRRWPGSTVVCVAGGPSLTQADVEACRGVVPVIAVNDAYRLAPWAEVLYACDYAWWRWHDGVPGFAGEKYTLSPKALRYPGVQLLRNTGVEGLETDPTGLRTGRNSGYQAINLALHLGAARVLLLGYDLQRTGGKSHWFGEHPHGRPPLSLFIPQFNALATAAPRYGLEILNCSRATALTRFRRVALADALALEAVPA